MRHALAPLALVLLVCCGGSKPPVETAAPESTETKPDESKAKSTTAENDENDDANATKIPEGCAGDTKDPCQMPKGFVKRLCAGVFPELALSFFQKSSPWKRAYVSVKEVAPFNGLGGPSAEEKLVFEEELLVLVERKADTGGMQVSGAGGSYDVLRWDGTCATLSAEEVRFVAPPKPKHATIPWRVLEDPTQEALKANEALSKIAIERKKECKGATMGAVSAKCEKADKALNDLVVEAVRSGTTVPTPKKVPQ